MSDMSSITKRLVALVRESKAEIVLIAQVGNPHRRAVDIPIHGPCLFVVDSLDGLHPRKS